MEAVEDGLSTTVQPAARAGATFLRAGESSTEERDRESGPGSGAGRKNS